MCYSDPLSSYVHVYFTFDSLQYNCLFLSYVWFHLLTSLNRLLLSTFDARHNHIGTMKYKLQFLHLNTQLKTFIKLKKNTACTDRIESSFIFLSIYIYRNRYQPIIAYITLYVIYAYINLCPRRTGLAQTVYERNYGYTYLMGKRFI